MEDEQHASFSFDILTKISSKHQNNVENYEITLKMSNTLHLLHTTYQK